MKRALALCGGGSKGSYEMGAWTALRELGINFDIVCGTSIGALNAVMVVQDEYNKCLNLWRKTRNDTILAKPIAIDDASLKKTFKNMQDLIPFLRSYIKEKGANIDPFKKTLTEYIDPGKVLASPLEFGVVCVHFPSFKPMLVNVKKLKYDEVIPYILASCSCFPLFPVCKIGNKNLIDGGYYDNLPIDFCLNYGASEIVAIDLNFNITHKEYLNKPFVKYIYPSWDLGGFFNFNETLINNNMILGYNDTMKAYGKYNGFRYTFYKDETLSFISHKFMLLLAMVLKDFRISKIKPREDISLYDILEKRVYRPLDYLDYYTRALEETMEYLKIDHFKIYQYDLAKELVTKEVLSLELKDIDWFKKYNELKTNQKKREFLTKIDINDVLVYCFNQLHDNKFLDKELVLNILAIYPNIVLILLLKMVWSDLDAEEEKNFGFTFEFES